MAGHSRRLLGSTVALAVAGALLGSASMTAAHERPVAPLATVAPLPASAPASNDLPVISTAVVASVAPPTTRAVAGGVARVASAPTSSFAAGLGVALLLTLLLAATLVAPRRVLVAALVLVLAVIAVEESVHSVHHLADQRAAAHCAVAAASAHVQGAAEPVPVPVVWVPTPIGAVVLVEPDHPGSRSLRPDEGRAPPSA